MNETEQRTAIMEFEKNRQMLGNISMQKQQMQMQLEIHKASLDELKNTAETTVMKVVGNLIVNKEKKEMESVKEKVESLELRIKTLDKQEEMTVKKLNTLKSQIEGSMSKDNSVGQTEKKKSGNK